MSKHTDPMPDCVLIAATCGNYPTPVYCDGYGPVWVYQESLGVRGIVRARTWEDAYEICEDEFLDECELTLDEIRAEYGFRREDIRIVREGGVERPVAETDWQDGRLRPCVETVRWETVETPDPDAWGENELFQEAYGFRPNGPRAGKRPDGTPLDPIGHGIYAKDLNGEWLAELTPALAEKLEIGLVWETCT